MKDYFRRTLAWMALAAPLVWGGCTSIKEFDEFEADGLLTDFSYAESEEGYGRLEVRMRGNKIVMFDGIKIVDKEGHYQPYGTPYDDVPDYMYIKRVDRKVFKITGEDKIGRVYGEMYKQKKKEILLMYATEIKELVENGKGEVTNQSIQIEKNGRMYLIKDCDKNGSVDEFLVWLIVTESHRNGNDTNPADIYMSHNNERYKEPFVLDSEIQKLLDDSLKLALKQKGD